MRIVATFIFLLLAELLQGQSAFLNRPSRTESASVLEKGVIQLESAYELELIFEDGQREKEVLIPEVMLRYGLGWGIELRVANHYEMREDDSGSLEGLSDLQIGTELQLFKTDDSNTEIALMSHLFVPSGRSGISNKRFGNETLLLARHQLGERTGIEYNIGYSNFEDDSERGNIVYSFVTEYEISEHSGAYIETYGELIELNELEASFDLGIAYQLNDHLEFEMAFGTGLNYKMMFISAGLSWRIDRFSRQTD